MFDGRSKKLPGGRYDTEVLLTDRYHWPKTVIDRQDTDYIDELQTFIEAQAAHETVQRRRDEQRQRRGGR